MNSSKLDEIMECMSDLPEFMGVPMNNDVNIKGNFGNSSLHIAAGWGDVSSIDELVRCGANLEAQGDESMTPLHRAATAGHPNAVVALLAHGANVGATDSAGHSAVDLARLLGRNEVISAIEEWRGHLKT